jgi:hypothetical protein
MQQNGPDNVAIIHVHLTSARLYVKVQCGHFLRFPVQKGKLQSIHLFPDADLALHDMASVTITSSNLSPRSAAIGIDDGAVGFSAKDGSGPSELA